ncbi:hypothetical protein GGX14DRAFT_609935 [Mycena pura]|uniref:Uncharacterized protein n=1 Tax=Mycena pura TaxID=153505 RepID=A0AAD6VJL9_9AGAR|nr:hypothetical protein GGX14DRAFT_609935 [Mycena pura]
MTLNPDAIADKGYESDTGERDNPSCTHFLNNQPVQKVIVVPRSRKVLNRTGRAICRIVCSHGWTQDAVAGIFGVSSTSVSRAVENIKYIPRDNVSEDYERVDPEFRIHFPPIQGPSVPRAKAIDIFSASGSDDDDELEVEYRTAGHPRAAKALWYSRLENLNESDVEGESSQPTPRKRGRFGENAQAAASISASGPAAKIPRYGSDVSPSLNSATQQAAKALYLSRLAEFNESDSEGESPSSQPTPPPKRGRFVENAEAAASISASGPAAKIPRHRSDVSTSQSSVSNSQSQSHKPGLATLFAQRKPSNSSLMNLPLMMNVSAARMGALSDAPDNCSPETKPQLKHTRRSSPTTTAPRNGVRRLGLPQPALYKPAAEVSPPPTPKLATFLRGSDLSAHADLLETQGFSVQRLHILSHWDLKEIQDALPRLLIGTKNGYNGMNAYEVISLEIMIRRLKTAPEAQGVSIRRLPLLPTADAAGSTTTLRGFLLNVMGLNLAAHYALLEAQGFSMERLSKLATWELEDMQELLQRTLLQVGRGGGGGGGGGAPLMDTRLGMKALEVLALEFAIRTAGH